MTPDEESKLEIEHCAESVAPVANGGRNRALAVATIFFGIVGVYALSVLAWVPKAMFFGGDRAPEVGDSVRPNGSKIERNAPKPTQLGAASPVADAEDWMPILFKTHVSRNSVVLPAIGFEPVPPPLVESVQTVEDPGAGPSQQNADPPSQVGNVTPPVEIGQTRIEAPTSVATTEMAVRPEAPEPKTEHRRTEARTVPQRKRTPVPVERTRARTQPHSAPNTSIPQPPVTAAPSPPIRIRPNATREYYDPAHRIPRVPTARPRSQIRR